MATARRSAALISLAFLIGACAGGTPGTAASIPAGAVQLRVADSRFAPAKLSVAPDQPFELYFDNADTLPHNVVIIGPDGGRVFAADIFTGVAQRVLHVPALAAGHYRLHCDIHPEMNGDLEASLSTAQGPT